MYRFTNTAARAMAAELRLAQIKTLAERAANGSSDLERKMALSILLGLARGDWQELIPGDQCRECSADLTTGESCHSDLCESIRKECERADMGRE